MPRDTMVSKEESEAVELFLRATEEEEKGKRRPSKVGLHQHC